MALTSRKKEITSKTWRRQQEITLLAFPIGDANSRRIKYNESLKWYDRLCNGVNNVLIIMALFVFMNYQTNSNL